jgi:hypothetical protein
MKGKGTAMKLAAIALASAFALSSTVALAQPVHHERHIKNYENSYQSPYEGMVHLHPNDGNPNGNPDGPTTLSGTGNSQFGGSSPGTSGYN